MLQKVVRINKSRIYAVLALRLVMGWLMFYAGITKLLNPSWTAAGFLNGSSGVFSAFFKALAGNALVDQLVVWGLMLIGLSLLLGAFVRLSSFFAVVMMILFYLPYFPPENGFVEEHVVYAVVFALLMIFDSGKFFGFDSKIRFLKAAKRGAKHEA